MLLCANISAQQKDSLRYPISDRRGDLFSSKSNNPFDLRDTGLLKQSVEYDPKTKQYYIVEKIGNQYYRTPTSFSMEEFLRLQGKKDEEDYFKKRSALLANMNRRLFKPKFRVSNDLFNRIVGERFDRNTECPVRTLNTGG